MLIEVHWVSRIIPWNFLLRRNTFKAAGSNNTTLTGHMKRGSFVAAVYFLRTVHMTAGGGGGEKEEWGAYGFSTENEAR